MRGEANSAEIVAAELTELQHINGNGSYSHQQIYNIDETTVFQNRMIYRT
jgi:hypothetical protein